MPNQQTSNFLFQVGDKVTYSLRGRPANRLIFVVTEVNIGGRYWVGGIHLDPKLKWYELKRVGTRRLKDNIWYVTEPHLIKAQVA